jgi:hypothetical protein
VFGSTTTLVSSRNGGLKMVGGVQRLYHERVIDHYENPRNVGSLDKNATDVGTGLVGAPACGDVMVRPRCIFASDV